MSIDGGGIKGVVPAAFLAVVEESAGVRLADHFDLIVGTSTGGIIALGLGLGYSAREILGMYEAAGPEIFPPACRLKPWTWRGPGLLRRKYSTAPLKRRLREFFRGKLLGQSRTRLMIPSTNLITGEIYIFKTSHSSRIEIDPFVPAEEVALATAAAPVFFAPHSIPGGQPLVDGGLWANNPTGFAVIEAVGTLGWDPAEIRVLSLGCTEEAPGFAKLARKRPGAASWGFGLLDAFFLAQSSAAMGAAKILLDDQEEKRILRVTKTVAKEVFRLDGARAIAEMKGLGESLARERLEKVRPLFLGAPAEEFVPCVPLAGHPS